MVAGGRLIQNVQSKASPRGFSDTKPPLMVGEFVGDDADYAMIVNLSLERSANVLPRTRTAVKDIRVVSPEDGRLTPLDATNGLWLVAGQGALLRLPREKS